MSEKDVTIAGQSPALTLEIIKKYICPKATEAEAFMFLQLCQAQGLNPFLREAYLIKYSDSDPASIVVGKDTFTKRAEKQVSFDGFRAGLILRDNDQKVNYREGALLVDGEKLLGGWAEVYRKDRKMPFRCEVSMTEYEGKTKAGEVTRQWKKMPATMIRKVPLVQALREAFPDAFGGMYSPEEMGIEALPTYEMGKDPAITLQPEIQEPAKKPGQKAPAKFMTKNPDEPSNKNQINALNDILDKQKITDDMERCKEVSTRAGLEEIVTSVDKLTYNQASQAIASFL